MIDFFKLKVDFKDGKLINVSWDEETSSKFSVYAVDGKSFHVAQQVQAVRIEARYRNGNWHEHRIYHCPCEVLSGIKLLVEYAFGHRSCS